VTRLLIKVADGMGGWAHFAVEVDDDGELRHPGASSLGARKALQLHPVEWLDTAAGEGVTCTAEVVE
jgi:hypothetical protein